MSRTKSSCDIASAHAALPENTRPRYTVDELLNASDYSQPQPSEEREWVDVSDVGGEIFE
jgi:antitoxin ChpS